MSEALVAAVQWAIREGIFDIDRDLEAPRSVVDIVERHVVVAGCGAPPYAYVSLRVYCGPVVIGWHEAEVAALAALDDPDGYDPDADETRCEARQAMPGQTCGGDGACRVVEG